MRCCPHGRSGQSSWDTGLNTHGHTNAPPFPHHRPPPPSNPAHSATGPHLGEPREHAAVLAPGDLGWLHRQGCQARLRQWPGHHREARRSPGPGRPGHRRRQRAPGAGTGAGVGPWAFSRPCPGGGSRCRRCGGPCPRRPAGGAGRRPRPRVRPKRLTFKGGADGAWGTPRDAGGGGEGEGEGGRGAGKRRGRGGRGVRKVGFHSHSTAQHTAGRRVRASRGRTGARAGRRAHALQLPIRVRAPGIGACMTGAKSTPVMSENTLRRDRVRMFSAENATAQRARESAYDAHRRGAQRSSAQSGHANQPTNQPINQSINAGQALGTQHVGKAAGESTACDSTVPHLTPGRGLQAVAGAPPPSGPCDGSCPGSPAAAAPAAADGETAQGTTAQGKRGQGGEHPHQILSGSSSASGSGNGSGSGSGSDGDGSGSGSGGGGSRGRTLFRRSLEAATSAADSNTLTKYACSYFT
jgi:hypothetical protein